MAALRPSRFVQVAPESRANSYKLLLSQQDASALVSLLESYEQREGVTVVGDKHEGGQGKVPRLVVAVRALARGFCTDAPLSSHRRHRTRRHRRARTDSTTHSTASANDIDNASATADGWASHEW